MLKFLQNNRNASKLPMKYLVNKRSMTNIANFRMILVQIKILELLLIQFECFKTNF